ncbi:MAG: alginate lyase [Candidatus Hydrogenedentota bacterium]
MPVIHTRVGVLLCFLAAVPPLSAQDAPDPGIPGFTLAFEEARAKLISRAKDALTLGPFSVVHKKSTPPSGDKHDFYSLSPYHWPNSDKPDGVPYVFRDGEVNPEAETNAYDRVRYFALVDAVSVLSQAYYWTGDRTYADRTALLLRAWFVDPSTRMNPNLQYAQHVPGNDSGPPWGVIRGAKLLEIIDGVKRIHPSGAWSPDDDAAFRTWLDLYLQWLQTSDKGKREAMAWNNHGTWYDAQAAGIAAYLGKREIVITILENTRDARIGRQFKPDGSQPLETRRTKSWDYCIMNLEGWCRLADLGEEMGVDLWNFSTAEGCGIMQALAYLTPFALGNAPWIHENIKDFSPETIAPLLMRAARASGDLEFHIYVSEIPGALPKLTVDALARPEYYKRSF